MVLLLHLLQELGVPADLEQQLFEGLRWELNGLPQVVVLVELGLEQALALPGELLVVRQVHGQGHYDLCLQLQLQVFYQRLQVFCGVLRDHPQSLWEVEEKILATAHIAEQIGQEGDLLERALLLDLLEVDVLQ